MNIQELEKVVNEYSEINSPDYAIMVSGPWGCGKTHFIKNCFTKSNKEMIYVSLYAVSSLEQINDKIFTSLISLNGVTEEEISKTSGFVGNIVKVFSDIDSGSAVGSIVSTIGSTIKSRMLASLSRDIVLVFDDLERASMRASKVLACVNEFVEHQKLAAIVLCDENKIKDKKFVSYKEKTILYTYHIEHSLEEKVDISFGGNIEMLGQHFDHSKAEFLRLLQNIECSNLRTLRLAVLSYSKLVHSVTEINSDGVGEQDMVRLLFPCLAYAIGFREMSLTSSELMRFSDKTMRDTLFLDMHRPKDKKEEESLKEFSEAVVQKDYNSIHVKSAYKIVCLGYLDVQSIKEDIKAWEAVTEEPKINILQGNFIFTDIEYDQMIKSLILSIKTKTLEIVSVEELARIIENLHELVRNGAVDYDIKVLEQEISAFVDDTIEHGEYDSAELLLRNQLSDDKFVKEIIEKLKETAVANRKKNGVIKQQKALITVVSSSIEEEVSEAYDFLYRYSTSSFILEGFVDEFVESVKGCTAIQLDKLSHFMRDRYGSTNIFEFLGDELSALEMIRDKLDDYFEGLPASVSKYQLGTLKRLIKSILESRERYGN